MKERYSGGFTDSRGAENENHPGKDFGNIKTCEED
jgi:hypothetical protein